MSDLIAVTPATAGEIRERAMVFMGMAAGPGEEAFYGAMEGLAAWADRMVKHFAGDPPALRVTVDLADFTAEQRTVMRNVVRRAA